MPIEARYSGICFICRDKYPVGTSIVKWDHRWSHPDCRDREIARKRRAGEVVVLPDDTITSIPVTRPAYKRRGRRYAAERYSNTD